jgi:hypothetical protein
MPLILRKFKNGYNYGDNLRNESKKLDLIIKQNFKKKDFEAKKEEKHFEGGIKNSLNKFNKKIKQKIRDF